MQRTIISGGAPGPAALDDLKGWLAISGPRDDARLSAMLATAAALCETFTRTLPLLAECQELLVAGRGWQALSARPVHAITGVTKIASDNTATPLAAEAYEIDIEADGTGRVRLRHPSQARTIAVRYTAGLAPDWSALPAPLKQGIVRMAAHGWRARDVEDGAAGEPPAAVAALWRPWRRMRLV